MKAIQRFVLKMCVSVCTQAWMSEYVCVVSVETSKYAFSTEEFNSYHFMFMGTCFGNLNDLTRERKMNKRKLEARFVPLEILVLNLINL